MRVLIVFFCSFIMLASCTTTQKIIKYEEHTNDFYANNNLRELLKTNNSPKMVLRINESDTKTSTTIEQQKNLNYLYTIMENELIKQGFSVKDRSTFNQIISKTSSSELLKKELSDADLVLDVINLDDKVAYSTNTVISVKNKKLSETKQSLQYRSLGAYVEYRLIVVKNNEIGGSFKFYYQPCSHGCPISDFKYLGNGKKKDTNLSKVIPNETIQQFIATSIQELVYFLQTNGRLEPTKN